MPKFNNVGITEETILKTRQHFINICAACIAEVIDGFVQVNDQKSYFAWNEQSMIEYKEGKNDHTFTFLQRAYWLQTGESVALLPK